MHTLLLWAAILLQVLKLSSSCGERLVGSGNIRSPNYPANYTNNLRCTWTLVAQPSQGNIVLDVMAFQTEPCCDILHVKDSTDTTVYRLFGANVSLLVLLGNSAVIEFVTDSSVVSYGFSIMFATTVLADFSRYNITVNTSCDLLSAKFDGWHDFRMNMQPSAVVFSMKASNSGQIVTQRIFYDSANKSVSFPVDYNTTYSVSAAPETCWRKTACDLRMAKSCINATNCIRGNQSAVATVTTVALKYELSKEGNSAVVKNVSPARCNPPQKITASCKTLLDYRCNNNAIRQGIHDCAAVRYYRCDLEVILNNGNTMRTSYNFDYAVAEREAKEPYSSIYMAAIIGGSSCFVVIVAAVTTSMILKHRNSSRSSKNSCVSKSAPKDPIKMTALRSEPTNPISVSARQEEDVQDLYVNMNSGVNEPHSTEYRYAAKYTSGLTDQGNIYAS